MSLRKAAEMALEALDCLPWQASPIAREATQALRQALAGDVTGDVTGDAVEPEWDAVDRFYVAKLKENT
jgi:hypothetical protein